MNRILGLLLVATALVACSEPSRRAVHGQVADDAPLLREGAEQGIPI